MFDAKTFSVAMADSVPLHREGFKAIVGRAPGLRLLGVTGNQVAVLPLCRDLRPDMLVVDSTMASVQLLRIVFAERAVRTVVVLVDAGERNAGFLANLLDHGANGLVSKSVDADRMVAALRRAHAARRHVDPEIQLVTTGADGSVSRTLSAREYEVLRLVGAGMRNSEIAEALFLSTETVRSHVKAILRKLGARDRTHALVIAYNVALLLPRQRVSENKVAPG